MTETQLEIAKICEDVKELLLYKNLKYGNSALDPIRVFSSSDTTEQLLVRIDDKLNRIKPVSYTHLTLPTTPYV